MNVAQFCRGARPKRDDVAQICNSDSKKLAPVEKCNPKIDFYSRLCELGGQQRSNTDVSLETSAKIEASDVKIQLSCEHKNKRFAREGFKKTDLYADARIPDFVK